MKKKDFVRELRELSNDKLLEKVHSLADEYLRLRVKKASNESVGASRFSLVKRQIATIRTVLKEKQLESNLVK